MDSESFNGVIKEIKNIISEKEKEFEKALEVSRKIYLEIVNQCENKENCKLRPVLCEECKIKSEKIK